MTTPRKSRCRSRSTSMSQPNPPALLSALVDAAFADGEAELSRAVGRRGVLRLRIDLVLGDGGRPLESVSSLVFEAKRHIKDNFARETKSNG